MRRLPLIAALAACIGVTVVTAAWCAESPHRKHVAFGARVRAYLMAHPEVIEEAIEALQAKREKAAADLSAKAIPAHLAELTQRAADPTLGDGPVTVVEFFDYRCGYCKAAAPHIPDLVAGHKAIRLVFKDYPILSPISDVAARAALAAAKQGKYLPVHLAFMAEKALDDDGINRILKEKGVDLVRAHADMQSEPVSKKIEENRALAREIGVDGTPGFVVADKVIGGFIEDDIIAATKAKVETPKTGT